MARIGYSGRALEDFERFVEFEAEHEGTAEAALSAIAEAVEILERHPLIGRFAATGVRELVISYAGTGHVALYRYDELADAVLVLRIRHQREAGYP